ncbi:MAG: aldo/keto reductase [Planctomycetaceae bacterium]|nr:aldo/keto reductase [Planctomycetaceae bacterium]
MHDPRDSQTTNEAGVPIRPLGKTGLMVSVLGFGGGHFCRKHISENESIRLVQEAVDRGVTFMDNAWEYHKGESERRMGLALEGGRRDKVVLMTKVCGRDAITSAQHLHDSLTRLKTDVIDVWQFHEMNYDNDPEWICSAGGALEAALKARDAGKIRFIGFTGHKSPHIFKKMLEQDFEWDTVQMPVTVLDAHYRSFTREILPELNRSDIGCIGMKSLGGDGQMVHGAGLTPQQSRGYAMSLPISTLVCGIESMENLEQDLDIALNHSRLSEEEQASLVSLVGSQAGDGRHEWYKSMQYYDSQMHREQHGFPPIAHVSDPKPSQ